MYAYLREDGTPYYIGKGINERAWNKKAHTISLPPDNRIIILESNLTNVGSLAIERRMIRWYGRKHCGTGILRNLTAGGDGSCEYAAPTTDEKRKNCSKRMKKEHQDENSVYTSIDIKKKKSTSMRIHRADKTSESKFNTKEYREKIRTSCEVGAEKFKRHYLITSPTGQVFKVVGLSGFCREHGLNKGAMGAVTRGTIPHYKKWTGHKI